MNQRLLFRRCRTMIGFLLALHSHISAQNASQTAAYLNDIVASLGRRVELQWALHKDVEAFNESMNRYYRQAPLDEPGRAAYGEKLTFQPTAFAAIWGASARKAGDLDSLLQRVSTLPDEREAAVAEKLSQLRRLHEQLFQLVARLEAYTTTADYREDMHLEQGYGYISRLAILYEDFSNVSARLQFDLQEVRNALAPADGPEPYAAVQRELMPLLRHSRSLLYAVRQGDTAEVRRQSLTLVKSINLAAGRKAATLKSIVPPPGQNPLAAYEAVLSQARELRSMALDYLGGAAVGASWQAYEREYFFFNQLMVNKFSRPGESVTASWNRIARMADLPLLCVSGEVNWVFALVPPRRSLATRAVAAAPEGRNLVVLLDISGSMGRPEKLPLARKTLAELVADLQANDRISLVTFTETAQVQQVSADNSSRNSLISSLSNLKPEGGSEIVPGLELAYAELAQHSAAGKRSEVLLITDGGFDLPETLAPLIRSQQEAGIHLSTRYVGVEEARMAPRLRRMAELGGGDYRYLQQTFR
ncbi:MAG: VWA domain-containing protein [Bacteroidetes bacterium]|nr:MAG: VWA domain-containing protein [Bacteroidota bacterium]